MSQPPSSTSRVASIQVLRGLAALLVVFYHLRFSEQLMSAPEDCLLPEAFKMGAVGVDLFFVISGFIMVTVTQKKIGTAGAVPEFLYSRFSRVYPIYWLFTLVILLLGLIKPSLLNVPIGAIQNIVQSFLLFPQGQFPILKVGWTLIHEIYFYLVFALFLFGSARLLPKALAAWSLFIAAGSILLWSRPPTPAGFVDVLISPLTMEFIVGCAIAILIQKKLTRPGWLALGLGVVWLAAFAFSSIHLNASFLATLQENWMRALFYGIPSATIVYGMVCLEKHQGRVLWPRLVGLGDASYSLYLVHLFVLSAMVKLWSMVPWHNTATKILWLGVMVIVCIVAGLLIHHFVEKPLLDFTHAARNRFFPKKSSSR